MKQFVFCLAIVPLLSFAQKDLNKRIKGELIIHGTIRGKIEPVCYIYAFFLDGNKAGLDSSKVLNGRYFFRAKTETTSLVTLYLKNPNEANALKQENMVIFLTEPTTVMVLSTDSFSNSTITGSKANNEFNKLEHERGKYSKQLQTLFDELLSKQKNNSVAAVTLLQKSIDSIRKVIAENYIQYVKTHPTSLIVPYALTSYLNLRDTLSDGDILMIKNFYFLLSPEQQASHYGRKIKKKLISFDIKVDMMAPGFFQSDTTGNLVSLESFRGQYVLLDFWASWCLPCRKENPTLVNTYNKYVHKGFTIISISLDKPGDQDKWKTAIQKDGLAWTHLSDLKFWDNAVAKLYRISEIPQNFLIGPSGKIIGKGLFGSDLEKKLKAIFESSHRSPE